MKTAALYAYSELSPETAQIAAEREYSDTALWQILIDLLLDSHDSTLEFFKHACRLDRIEATRDGYEVRYLYPETAALTGKDLIRFVSRVLERDTEEARKEHCAVGACYYFHPADKKQVSDYFSPSVDYDIMQPFRDFLARPRADTSFADLVQECLMDYERAYDDAFDFYSSISTFQELMNAGLLGYDHALFRADGSRAA